MKLAEFLGTVNKKVAGTNPEEIIVKYYDREARQWHIVEAVSMPSFVDSDNVVNVLTIEGRRQ